MKGMIFKLAAALMTPLYLTQFGRPDEDEDMELSTFMSFIGGVAQPGDFIDLRGVTYRVSANHGGTLHLYPITRQRLEVVHTAPSSRWTPSE